MSLGSSSSISDDIFDTPPSATGRSLLQATTNCPMAFEFSNYTNITSQYKIPYSPVVCRSAFKAFACPYVNLLTDESTDCARQMFSYLSIHGNYPPALSSSLCREGKGSPAPSHFLLHHQQNDNATGLQTAPTSWPLQISTAGPTLILFWIF